MHDVESNREQTELLLAAAGIVNGRFSRREFLQNAAVTGATIALWLNCNLLIADGLNQESESPLHVEVSGKQTIIWDYFGKNIGRKVENITIPDSIITEPQSDLIGTRPETYQFESKSLTPTRPAVSTLENTTYLPIIMGGTGSAAIPPSLNPFLGSGNWIRYFDQNTRNHIDLTINDQDYRFIIVNNIKGGKVTIWAVGFSPRHFEMLTAIQLTDFKLTRQQLDLTALDMNRGILYCVTHSTYSDLKTTKGIIEDPQINWIIAINAKQLIRDTLEGSFSWQVDQQDNPSQALNYFIDVNELPRRCNIPFARTDSDTHDVGWGIVYDHSRNRLPYATTDVCKRTDDVPTGSRLYAIDFTEPPQFYYNGRDRRIEDLILDEQKLPIHDPNDENADSSADVAIAHLMINPWNENIMAVHNYSGVKGGSFAADNYLDNAPAEIVYFDFSNSALEPGVFHLNLPGPNAGQDPNGEADRFMGHHSFISKNAMIANHGFRPVINYGALAIIIEYPYGRPFLNSLSPDYAGQVAVVTCHEHAEWWWLRKNDENQYLRFKPSHLTMSPDRKFMVQDTDYLNCDLECVRNPYDELLLWFRTHLGYSCYTIVRKNLPRDENGDILPVKVIHPHPVFIDNQTFLYNHTVAASCNQDLSDGSWSCPEAEVRIVTIPDAILALDLLPIGSESNAGVLAYMGI